MVFGDTVRTRFEQSGRDRHHCDVVCHVCGAYCEVREFSFYGRPILKAVVKLRKRGCVGNKNRMVCPECSQHNKSVSEE